STPPHAQPSFPTRRSSDLSAETNPTNMRKPATRYIDQLPSGVPRNCDPTRRVRIRFPDRGRIVQRVTWVRFQMANTTTAPPRTRSEEHTSELQSRFDLVCR